MLDRFNDFNETAARGFSLLLLLSLICVFPHVSVAHVSDFGQTSSSMTGESPDTITNVLDSIVVTARAANPVRMNATDRVTLDTEALGKYMRMAGDADPLRYVMMMPGVSQNSDYSSGLNVDGSDYSQSLVLMDGTTVYFPYHFGGIFSIFNYKHFPVVTMEKSLHNASMPLRSGALIEALSDDRLVDSFSGSANIGMLSSSLSLRMPLPRKWEIRVSGRLSYINTMYQWLLNMEHAVLRYDFSDMNVTAMHQFGESDILKISYAGNNDKLKIIDKSIDNNTSMKWRNNLASVKWSREPQTGMSANASIYFTEFHNLLNLYMPGMELEVPSGILTVGLKGAFRKPVTRSDDMSVETGGELSYSRFEPQNVFFKGAGYSESMKGYTATAYEGRVYGEWSYRFGRGFSTAAGIKLSGYVSDGYKSGYILPSLTFGWDGVNDSMKAHFSLYPQYFHQVGLSEIGVSSNFWVGAAKSIPAQLSVNCALGWDHRFGASGWSLALEPYFKRILNQPEYSGTAFDLIDADYSPYSHMVSANGFNTGVNVTVSKTKGKLTGWAGYTLGIARRRFPGYDRYLPAASECLNKFTLFASYFIDRRWRVSANFVYHTGNPVTPVREIYLIGQNVMVTYGDKNSSHLPDYYRLDLSGTFSFNINVGRKVMPCYVNLSLINATGHKNVEFSYYRFDADNLEIKKREVKSIFRFLPSLSFTVDF